MMGSGLPFLVKGIMTEGYYCTKCKVFVKPIQGEFIHPDRGRCSCYVWPECKKMGYLKEEK